MCVKVCAERGEGNTELLDKLIYSLVDIAWLHDGEYWVPCVKCRVHYHRDVSFSVNLDRHREYGNWAPHWK